jgi:hypothetical protein
MICENCDGRGFIICITQKCSECASEQMEECAYYGGPICDQCGGTGELR